SCARRVSRLQKFVGLTLRVRGLPHAEREAYEIRSKRFPRTSPMDEPAHDFPWPDDPRCAVAAPVLFTAWKHHAGVLRGRIRPCAALGAPALDALAEQVIVMGTELMDLYTGAHWPAEVAETLVAALSEQERLERGPFHSWL